MNNYILMTEEDKTRWGKNLFKYYRQKGEKEEKIQNIIDEIFVEVQSGWVHAPRSLDTRIKMKTGFQWKSHSNLRPKRAQSVPEKTSEDDDDLSSDLFSFMNKKEKEWWANRLEEYRGDFDFNESSDKPLLDQLLVDELIQRRLFRKQLKYAEKDYNKRLNDSVKRVSDVQTKLGITREQRAGVLNKIDGNIANLASDFEEKIKNMPEILRKEYAEEMYYQNLKDQKDPINILPPIEKIEALLNVEGKISANLDSTKISEISEEAIKETKKIRKLKQKKQKFAEGISIP